MQPRIQLFRERLSYNSVKVNVTMSKVIMGNDGFALIEAQGISALEKEAAQTRAFMQALTL